MLWNAYIKGFRDYLLLEKSFSINTINSYLRDVRFFAVFIHENYGEIALKSISREHLVEFISYFNKTKSTNPNSQSRCLSSIKSFFNYLLYEESIEANPLLLVDFPKQKRTLPETLSIQEVQKIFKDFDFQIESAHRDRAILEVLYSCGLRVSELCNLKINEIFKESGIIRVIGKGNKQRLIPIGSSALKHVQLYIDNERNKLEVKKGDEDTLFLNNQGSKISRVTVFEIVKKWVKNAGIPKNISPHTFRHSFATHMVKNKADLRSVQEMLGHASITTTEIYTHLDKEYLREALDQHHPFNK